MSGAQAAQALHEHFEDVRRTELGRLQKKVASLTAADQAAVETMTADVIDALARHPAQALARDESPLLVRTLMDLFRVA